MKEKLAILPLMTVLLTSCSVVTGIFKAGAVVGVIAVIVVIAIIIWIVSLFSRKS